MGETEHFKCFEFQNNFKRWDKSYFDAKKSLCYDISNYAKYVN